jgi:hypothetical protein
LVCKPYANLPDTLVAIATTSKYFLKLPALLEHCKGPSDSARAFSRAPESTCSVGDAFRMLQDMTIRIVEYRSY